MPSIGRVTKQVDGSYKGHLATLSIRKNIEIIPLKGTKGDQPNFRVMAGDIEVGAGWTKTGRESGEEYISLSLAAPEFGNQTLYANLGQEAGQDEEDVLALIWNPKN